MPICITLSSYLSSPTGLSCSQKKRACQKQRGLFQNSKKVIFGQVKETRSVRNIGLGFKTPREVPGQFVSLYKCLQAVLNVQVCLIIVEDES